MGRVNVYVRYIPYQLLSLKKNSKHFWMQSSLQAFDWWFFSSDPFEWMSTFTVQWNVLISSTTITQPHIECLSKVFQSSLTSALGCLFVAKLNICVVCRREKTEWINTEKRNTMEEKCSRISNEIWSVDNKSPAATNGTCETSLMHFFYFQKCNKWKFIAKYIRIFALALT